MPRSCNKPNNSMSGRR
ncbi:hypothetical protein Gotur_016212 [Gossypium turneri]